MSHRRRWIVRASLVVAALTVPVLLLELSLRLFGPYFPGNYRTGQFQAIHPLYGRFHVPNFDGWIRTPEFTSRMRTNSLGLRDDEIAMPRPPGTFRILVIGDSFVQGSQVSPGEPFADQLERSLNRLSPHPGGPARYDVVNAGIGGWGPAEQYLWLLNEGSRLEPDLIIQQIYLGNDISDAGCKITGQDELKHKVCFYLDANGQLYQGELRLRPERQSDPLRQALRQWLMLFNVIETGVFEKVDYGGAETRATNWQSNMYVYAKSLPRRDQRDWDEAWQISAALIERTRDQASALGARYLLVAAPTLYQTYPGVWERTMAEHRLRPEQWDLERPNQRLAEIARGLSVPYLDLGPAFRKAAPQAQPLFYQGDLHFTPAGHAVVAGALQEHLLESGLAP